MWHWKFPIFFAKLKKLICKCTTCATKQYFGTFQETTIQYFTNYGIFGHKIYFTRAYLFICFCRRYDRDVIQNLNRNTHRRDFSLYKAYTKYERTFVRSEFLESEIQTYQVLSFYGRPPYWCLAFHVTWSTFLCEFRELINHWIVIYRAVRIVLIVYLA